MHDNFGTWRSELRIILGQISIEHVPATVEREPSSIFTLTFPGLGVWEENNLGQPVIWSVAPESMIQGSGSLVTPFKAVKNVSFYAKWEEPDSIIELDEDVGVNNL